MLRRIIFGSSAGAQSVGFRFLSKGTRQLAQLEEKLLAVELDLKMLSAQRAAAGPQSWPCSQEQACHEEKLSVLAQRTVDAARVAGALADSQLNRTFSRGMDSSHKSSQAPTAWNETPDAVELEQELAKIECTVQQLHRVSDAQMMERCAWGH